MKSAARGPRLGLAGLAQDADGAVGRNGEHGHDQQSHDHGESTIAEARPYGQIMPEADAGKNSIQLR